MIVILLVLIGMIVAGIVANIPALAIAGWVILGLYLFVALLAVVTVRWAAKVIRKQKGPQAEISRPREWREWR